jgi:hypothetical protein
MWRAKHTGWGDLISKQRPMATDCVKNTTCLWHDVCCCCHLFVYSGECACMGEEVQLHAFLTLAVDGGKWSASCPGCSTPVERTPVNQLNGRFGGPLTCAVCWELNPSSYLMFVEPCIVIYFYSKTNQVHNISILFYFYLYLHVACWQAATESVWHIPDAVCTVLDSWWWTERSSETHKVLFQNKINLRYCASGWFYCRNPVLQFFIP